MATNFEKYLAGEPLNDELAALKAGRLPEFELFHQNAGIHALNTLATDVAIEEAERELTREERVALRELRTSAAWPVLQKLLQRATITRKKLAMRMSEDEPLSPQLPNTWLELRLWKQLIGQLNWSIAVELESLEDPHETDPTVEGT